MRQLVLCDLDLTLVTQDFLLTTTELPAQIAAMQRQGFQFGIHSDRPYCTLERYYRALGMNGPIISERGNAIRFPNETPPHFIHNHKLIPQIHAITLLFLETVRRQYPQLNILWGEFLYREMKKLTVERATDFLLFNGDRQYSLGMNCLHLDPAKTALEREAAAWELLMPISQLLFAAFRQITGTDPDMKCYHRNNACIAHQLDTQKSQASDILLRTRFADRIFMIGDHPQDFLGDDPRLVHCAVANAEPEYKALCQFVADHEFTEGVLDCLRWIQKKSVTKNRLDISGRSFYFL